MPPPLAVSVCAVASSVRRVLTTYIASLTAQMEICSHPYVAYVWHMRVLEFDRWKRPLQKKSRRIAVRAIRAFDI